MRISLDKFYEEKMEEYSAPISENIESIEDKELLSNTITSFTSLKEQIAKEQEEYVLLSDNKFNEYNEQIDSYISSCESRIEAIKEAEAKKKAEEEAAAEVNSYENNYSYNDYNDYSYDYSSNNGGESGSSSVDTSGMYYRYFYTDTGEKVGEYENILIVMETHMMIMAIINTI